jgi:predicted nucleotidyltransferase component of viral defense system
MMERFLERIAVSDYKHNFILKGGMLIAAMVGIDARTTMDMDATIKGQNLSKTELTAIIEDILKMQIEDGALFSFQGIEEIREEAEYPGYRVSIGAVFDKTRQMLKIDTTTGDAVTPKEIDYDFKLMFEDRISIMAYNLETVLAEKFETIITRGVTNTRTRDFYDVYVLINTYAFDAKIFRTALDKTAEKRGTTKQMSAGTMNTIDFIMKNEIMADLWQKYQKKYFYAGDISWVMVISAVKALAENAMSS